MTLQDEEGPLSHLRGLPQRTEPKAALEIPNRSGENPCRRTVLSGRPTPSTPSGCSVCRIQLQDLVDVPALFVTKSYSRVDVGWTRVAPHLASQLAQVRPVCHENMALLCAATIHFGSPTYEELLPFELLPAFEPRVQTDGRVCEREGVSVAVIYEFARFRTHRLHPYPQIHIPHNE